MPGRDAIDDLAEAAARVAEQASARAKVHESAEAGRLSPEGPDEWTEPDLSILSSGREPAPDFPTDVFGDFWSRYVAEAAAEKSAPPDYVGLPLLSLAGAALANVRRGSPWPGWSEPPVINTANVGKPSSGKSPAADVARDLAASLEQDWNDDLEERGRAYRTRKVEAEAKLEAWTREVKDAVKDRKAPPLEPEGAILPDAPESRRLVIADVTVEKATRLAATNPRGLLLMRDELAGWIGNMDKYGASQGGERAFWLEAYGGRFFVVDRVKEARPVRIPYLAIGITGGVQPDRLPLLFGAADDGLAARFIYAGPEPIPPSRPTLRADHETALRRLRQLRDLAMAEEDGKPIPLVLPFEDGAADAIQDWRLQVADLESEVEGLFCSWLGKLPGMAVRLAVVLEHLWWCVGAQPSPFPRTISERAVVAAIAFLDAYAIPMARRAFGDAARSQPERDAAAIARWLRRQKELPDTINAREIRRSGILSDEKAEACAAAFAELEDAGWVRPAPSREGGGKGRQRKDWAVNPKLEEPR